MKKGLIAVAAIAALTAAMAVQPASASHSWGGYHWARTANPFTIKLGNNMTAGWQTYLSTSSSDWNVSTVLKNAIVPGLSSARKCLPTAGRVEVCNNTYGQNGWLGLAQIWLSSGHISQGVVKINDTYFNMAQYNNSSEKEHVVCQEIGHTFGLDHQDTTGASLNTCMDYYLNTSAADTLSIHPNQHDYDQLVTIYSHTDTFNSATLALPRPITPSPLVDVQVDELGNGTVTWTIPAN